MKTRTTFPPGTRIKTLEEIEEMLHPTRPVDDALRTAKAEGDAEGYARGAFNEYQRGLAQGINASAHVVQQLRWDGPDEDRVKLADIEKRIRALIAPDRGSAGDISQEEWKRRRDADEYNQAMSPPASSAGPTPDPSMAGSTEVPEEEDVRYALWIRHGHGHPHLYGDDGEMQCNACPPPAQDYKRAPLPMLVRTALTAAKTVQVAR